MRPEVAVVREDWADQGVPLPQYATPGAAGADVRANLTPETRDNGLVIAPMERAIVPTGLRVAVPPGYEMQVRPRSGLAYRHGISLANTPGTIDSDYRGPLGVLVVNLGSEPFTVEHGDRIAQLVVAPVAQADYALMSDLDDTARGAGGFGSTGQA